MPRRPARTPNRPRERDAACPSTTAGHQLAGGKRHVLSQSDPDREQGHAETAEAAQQQRKTRRVELDRRTGNGAAPERGQAVEHQPGIEQAGADADGGAEQRHESALGQKQPLDTSSRPADRQEHSDLRTAALDAEDKEQARQNDRRADQEHAQAQEELAEIGAARDRLAGPARVPAGRTAPRVAGSTLARQVLCNLPVEPLPPGIADRRQTPVLVAPSRLAGLQRDEGLGRAPILVPVLARPSGGSCPDRPGTPGSQSRQLSTSASPGNSGISEGSRAAPSSGTIRDDLESPPLFVQLSPGPHDIVGEIDRIADLGPEIVGKPLVDDDLIGLHVRPGPGLPRRSPQPSNTASPCRPGESR